MTEPKFTPGPWRVREHWCDEGAFEVYPARDKDPKYGQWAELAEVPEYGPKDAPQAKANANLIAAAPELYEALEWCLAILENGGGWVENSKENAHAALAKARGEG